MISNHALYDWGGLNVSLFHAINRNGGELLRPLAIAGNFAGDYCGMPALLCVLLLLAHNSAQRDHFLAAARLSLQARRLLVGFLLAWLSVGLLKVWLNLPRPVTVLGPDVQIIGTPHDLYSLPSGHAAYAALVAAVFWGLVKPVFRPLLVTFVVWVGWSRIAAGAHFPADVVAGGLIGSLSGMIAHQIAQPLSEERNLMSMRYAFDRVLEQAKQAYAVGEWTRVHPLLQDAHVLGQCLFWPHLLSHLWMLRLAYARQDWQEVRGQILRLALAPVGNITGRLPFGNSGDASVNAFRPMPVPIRLKEILEKKYD